MTRPPCDKKIKYDPPYKSFKPEGCPKSELDTISICPEEAEALRLKDVEGLEQTEAAIKMGISQSTFQRILTAARKKVSTALLEGKQICIESVKK